MRLFYILLILVNFISVVVSVPGLAQSELDYSIDGTFRSLPIGALVTGSMGRAQTIWGEKKDKSDWKYGLFRAGADIRTAAVVNRLTANLDVYPVSIFGFGVGQSWGSRLIDSSYFDCETLACRGLISRTHVHARLALKAKGFFFMGRVLYEFLFHGDQVRGFAEDLSVLFGAPSRDFLLTKTAALGYELNDQWRVGGFYQGGRMLESGAFEDMGIAFAAYRKGAWRYLGGLGLYNGHSQNLGFTFVLGLKWVGQQGLLLF